MNETSAKPRRRWFQSNLQSLFLLIALLSVGLSWWREHVKLNGEIQHHETIHQAADKEIFALLAERDAAIARVYELSQDPKSEPFNFQLWQDALGGSPVVTKTWNDFVKEHKARTRP